MATKANIIKVYAQADSAKKVDIIIRYYPNFMGIVESYTDGLRYMIENEINKAAQKLLSLENAAHIPSSPGETI